MALALALVIAAVVVSVAQRGDAELVAAAKTAATKSLAHPQRYSSGEEDSATGKSSSEKEEPLGYGPSSGGPVGQREGEAKEPHDLLQPGQAG
jgi:hypothetical protein